MGEYPLRALVVEESLELATRICEWLRRKHHTCVLCQCPAEARTLAEAQRFDLVVLSWSRHDRDHQALALARWLRAQRRHRLPAVLMLSDHTSVDDIQVALQTGVTDLLTKPVNPVHLQLRLGQMELAAHIAVRQRELQVSLSSREPGQPGSSPGSPLAKALRAVPAPATEPGLHSSGSRGALAGPALRCTAGSAPTAAGAGPRFGSGSRTSGASRAGRTRRRPRPSYLSVIRGGA